ncbi:type I pantothenate kinase [Streptomyces sp. NPDC021098]|uniref:type I pantothenate kinase n=1 Tax=unclassified Streptomyces TaxID=2593676 RepID=UPI0037A3218C
MSDLDFCPPASLPTALGRPRFSPFREFTRESWSGFRDESNPPVTDAELDQIRSIGDPVDMHEVTDVYLPLSRLVRLHVLSAWQRRKACDAQWGAADFSIPFVLGIVGGVAVGKSTLARLLRLLITRWPERPSVALVTTDGFLRPTAELRREGLLSRKGFPESYRSRALLEFMHEVKAGVPEIEVPVYSHLAYDVVPGENLRLHRPDILLVEGLNVLQPPAVTPEGRTHPVVSDYVDLGVYLDARNEDIRRWYVERFLTLRDTAFRAKASYFSHYAGLDDEQAREQAHQIYAQINEVNLVQNIEPTLGRADIVLHKRADHKVSRVWLRKW